MVKKYYVFRAVFHKKITKTHWDISGKLSGLAEKPFEIFHEGESDINETEGTAEFISVLNQVCTQFNLKITCVNSVRYSEDYSADLHRYVVFHYILEDI